MQRRAARTTNGSAKRIDLKRIDRKRPRPGGLDLGRLGLGKFDLGSLVVAVAGVALVVGIALGVSLTVNDLTAPGPVAPVATAPGSDGAATADAAADGVAAGDVAAGDVAGFSPSPAAPGREEHSRKQWQALLPLLQTKVRESPDDRGARQELALAYYNLGMFNQAAAVYQDLLATAENAVLRDRLGNVLRDMGDIAGAESAYGQALAQDPSLAAAYLNLAESLWRRGELDEALAVVEEGINSVPEEDWAALIHARHVIRQEMNR